MDSEDLLVSTKSNKEGKTFNSNSKSEKSHLNNSLALAPKITETMEEEKVIFSYNAGDKGPFKGICKIKNNSKVDNSYLAFLLQKSIKTDEKSNVMELDPDGIQIIPGDSTCGNVDGSTHPTKFDKQEENNYE
jgi:hypothetical protein